MNVPLWIGSRLNRSSAGQSTTPAMRLLLAIALAMLAGLAAMGCGSAGTATVRGSAVVVEHTITVSPELGPIDSDDFEVLDFGHAADSAESTAIVRLVKRYYAAAQAGDGAKACPMLFSSTIAVTVMDEYRSQPGLGGNTCQEVLSKLFEQRHGQLVEDYRSLRIVRIRTAGVNGFVVMRVPWTDRARQLSVRLAAGKWQLQDQPVDMWMP